MTTNTGEALQFEKDLAALVKSVLGTDKGHELLKKLGELYDGRHLYSDNSLTMAYRVAKRDLIKDLEYLLRVSDIELEKVYHINNQDIDDL